MIPIGVYQYSFLPLSETFIYRQLCGIAERFDLRLYSMSLENINLFPGFSPIVVPKKSVYEILSRNYKGTTFTPSRKRFIVNILKNVKLLYVNFGHMALSMQEMAAEASIPVLCFFHGVDASAFLKDKNYVGEYAKSTFHTAFTNSENMKLRLRPYLPKSTEIKVVHYGVDPKHFPFKLHTRVRKGAIFLQISRLDYKKGIDISLEVFSRYHREIDPSAKYIIAGDGPRRKELQELTIGLNIEDCVRFLGKIDHRRVIKLLQEADVMLQHSVVAPDGDMEGVPNVLIEAMACGIPVVSTYHSGIPELVKAGVNGLLVKERDTEEYFNVLASLSSINIETVSVNARKTVEEDFNSEINNRKLCNYIEEVLD